MPNVMDKRLIDKNVGYFATQPVVKAWVFGSYARGEAHSGSDIDILVAFDKEAKVSLMRHFLVHGYYQVDPDEVWNVIEKELQPLKEQVAKYFAEME